MTPAQNIPDGDQPVRFSYASSRNITFHGEDESGYTRAEWAEMTEAERGDALLDYVNGLVDVGADWYPEDN